MTTQDTKTQKMISAALYAFLLLEEYIGEYDEDSGPPPDEMVRARDELSSSLTDFDAHPYDKRYDDEEKDDGIPPF